MLDDPNVRTLRCGSHLAIAGHRSIGGQVGTNGQIALRLIRSGETGETRETSGNTVRTEALIATAKTEEHFE